MPRNMSFMLTVPQIQDQTKDVTRRLGWWNLKPGDVVNACVKCMGLKKGEKVQKICRIKIVSTRREPLYMITQADVIREGFYGWSPDKFMDMFCNHNKCRRFTFVNRIEFKYV